MVVVAQLVRVAVCGAAGRRFEPGQPPRMQKLRRNSKLFLWNKVLRFIREFFLKQQLNLKDVLRCILRHK